MNKYFPPDWDPSHGTAHRHNKLKMKGHVAKRDDTYLLLENDLEEMRKQEEGEDVQVSFGRKKARLELPFNVWCDGCGRHLAKNVRFNSEKQQVGNYYRTAIWEFTFTCPSCPQVVVMRTNPKEQSYNIKSGARLQHLEEKKEEAEELNPFALLEKKVEEEKRVMLVVPRLQELKKAMDLMSTDDFGINRQLRSEHREVRKSEAREEREKKSLSQRYALGDLKLGPETCVDKKLAAQVNFINSNAREKIKQQSILTSPTAVSSRKLSKRSKKSLLEELDFCK